MRVYTSCMSATYIDEYTRPFRITPGDTALLIVDMQYASGSRDHGLGLVLREQGRLDEAEDRFNRIDNVLVPNIKRLQEGFRAAGATVIHIVLGPALPDYSDAPRHPAGLVQGDEQSHRNARARDRRRTKAETRRTGRQENDDGARSAQPASTRT